MDHNIENWKNILKFIFLVLADVFATISFDENRAYFAISLAVGYVFRQKIIIRQWTNL